MAQTTLANKLNFSSVIISMFSSAFAATMYGLTNGNFLEWTMGLVTIGILFIMYREYKIQSTTTKQANSLGTTIAALTAAPCPPPDATTVV